MVDFASVSWVVNNKVFTLFFTGQIHSTNIGIVVCNWEDVYLQNVFIDLSESLDQFFFELLFSLLSVFVKSLGNKGEIGVILFVVEKESNFRVSLVQNANSYLFVMFVSLLSIIELEESTWQKFMCFVLLIFGIDNFFLSDKYRKMGNIDLACMLFQNLFGFSFSQLMQNSFILIVVLVGDEINKIETDFSALILHIIVDLDANGFQFLS